MGPERRRIELARALRVAGDDPFILANAAIALTIFGEDIATAVAPVDHSLQLNPNFARAWHLSGQLRLWAGSIRPCDCILKRPLASRMSYLVIRMGHFFARRTKPEKVAEMLGLALQANSEWPPTLRFMASYLAQLVRLKEAQEMMKRLQAIDPVVIPTTEHWRVREDREYFLQGLYLALGQTA